METVDLSKTLYKLNGNGTKIQQWRIYIDERDNEIYIMKEYGQIDGKLQLREKKISKAKSKKTIKKQAIFQAQRDWLDQVIKKQYSVKMPKIQDSKKQKIVKIFTPMLAQTYKEAKGFETPCLVQPKLDGVRAYFYQGKFRSRNHKEYYNMNHLIKNLLKIKINVIFDGELYNHDMTFQELMKYVKLKEIKEIKDDKENMIPEIKKYVKYHIFDCYFPDNPEMSFKDRYAYLQSFQKELTKATVTAIKIVDVEEISEISELEAMHDEYASQGYEGIMLRTPESPYEFKRSKFLQKYKKFIDDEFEIIGFDKEVQDKISLVIWKCKTKEGLEFNCRPKGTHEERAELYKNAKNYIGKNLTVVFQEYTDEGKPRFPVGKGFREDI